MTKKGFILIWVLASLFLTSYGNSSVQSEEITALYSYESMVYYGTNRGKIYSYNSKNKSRKLIYQFPKIHDFMGEEIDAEIFKVVSKNFSVFALVHAEGGNSNLYEIRKNKLILHLKGDEINAMMNSLELWGHHLYIGLISSELIKYNWQKRQEIYRMKIGSYALSSMSFIKDGRWIFAGDEAGKIYQINILKPKIQKVYDRQHVDNVMAVAYGGAFVFGGGKDRRLSFYALDQPSSSHLQFEHFVYILAANKEGNLLAFYDDFHHKVLVMDRHSKKIIKEIAVGKASVQKMIFLDNNTLVWAAENLHLENLN